jgi:hypothetical protein
MSQTISAIFVFQFAVNKLINDRPTKIDWKTFSAGFFHPKIMVSQRKSSTVGTRRAERQLQLLFMVKGK